LLERVRSWYEYRNSWETIDTERYYNRVVRQGSGYVVHIYEREIQENLIDGAKRKRLESEVDTVFYPYMSSVWEPGRPVKWDGKRVEPQKELMVFGNVARGYQR
jgi:hypothetical protein